MLIFVCLFLLLFIFTLILFYYFVSNLKTICIYDLAINRQVLDKTLAIRKITEDYSEDYLFMIILQDDIKFFDKKYYWPKNTAYVHLSDVNNFLNKYSPEKNNYTREEIVYFMQTKVVLS